VAFARSAFDIARDLIRRQELRDLKPNEDYSVLRRSINFALRDVARVGHLAPSACDPARPPGQRP
jgi:hypothetical protein